MFAGYSIINLQSGHPWSQQHWHLSRSLKWNLINPISLLFTSSKASFNNINHLYIQSANYLLLTNCINEPIDSQQVCVCDCVFRGFVCDLKESEASQFKKPEMCKQCALQFPINTSTPPTSHNQREWEKEGKRHKSHHLHFCIIKVDRG